MRPTNSPKAVLVVDDNPLTARVVQSLFRKMGFATEIAFDGEEAIQRLAEKPFEMVVSDVEMPVRNGFALLDFVRARWPDLPVVLMSGTSDAERRETARTHGARAFVEKPVRPNHLTALVGEAGIPAHHDIQGLHLFAA